MVVISGRDKGKRGSVVRFVATDRLLVEGINRAKKHEKPNPNKGTAGGIIEKEMPVHISNVSIFNPVTKKADRIGVKRMEDGRQVRVYKSNGEMVDVK